MGYRDVAFNDSYDNRLRAWTIGFVTIWMTFYFVFNRGNLNALASGDDSAKGLGVEINRLRLTGMFLAALG